MVNPVDRSAERIEMAKEACEHLDHAEGAIDRARSQVDSGFYLGATLAAQDASVEAVRARKLLMGAWIREGDDSELWGEPTEEEKAEMEEEMARAIASEDLLAACEAAKKYLELGDPDPDDFGGSWKVYEQLGDAIEKARPV